MASATQIPLSEYLTTTYRPDCDYIDGEIKERNLGERSHALLQLLLGAFFNRHWRVWNVIAGTEFRVRTSDTHVRIPDVCVLRRSDPPDPVVLVAPLICIEVLSPCDSLRSVRDRVDDFLNMGVEHVWLVDPVSRAAHVATKRGYEELLTGEFTVPGTPIRVPLAEVFAELHEMETPG